MDQTPEMLNQSPVEINKRMKLFIKKTVNITSKDNYKVEQETKDQSHPKLWKEERKKDSPHQTLAL